MPELTAQADKILVAGAAFRHRHPRLFALHHSLLLVREGAP